MATLPTDFKALHRLVNLFQSINVELFTVGTQRPEYFYLITAFNA